MKPTKQNFFAEISKHKPKKYELESVNDLLSLTDEADSSFRSFDDDINDWVNKYIDLQNEANVLVNQYDIWQGNTDSLEAAMESFASTISDLGINPMEVPAYGSAERTVSAYRVNDDQYNEILNAAKNMTNL